jgi:hypothetical protein
MFTFVEKFDGESLREFLTQYDSSAKKNAGNNKKKSESPKSIISSGFQHLTARFPAGSNPIVERIQGDVF